MQKNRCLAFVLVLIFSLVLVSALDSSYIDQQAKAIDQKVQNVTTSIETTKTTLTNQEVRDAYLKEQWVAILENRNGFKQIITVYRAISPYTDPALEFILGMVPVFSLFFILVLIIWVFLVKYYFTTYEVLKDFAIFSNSTSLIVSLSFFFILLLLRVFQILSIFLANKLVALTEFLTSPIMKIIAFAVFIVAIVFLSKFSKQVNVFARYIRMQNSKRKKENEEEDRAGRQESATRSLERIARATIGE